MYRDSLVCLDLHVVYGVYRDSLVCLDLHVVYGVYRDSLVCLDLHVVYGVYRAALLVWLCWCSIDLSFQLCVRCASLSASLVAKPFVSPYHVHTMPAHKHVCAYRRSLYEA